MATSNLCRFTVEQCRVTKVQPNEAKVHYSTLPVEVTKNLDMRFLFLSKVRASIKPIKEVNFQEAVSKSRDIDLRIVKETSSKVYV